MWVTWIVVHHPSLNLEPTISGPTLLMAGLLAALHANRARIHRPVLVGGLSGLIAGAITLACVTSILVQQSDPSAGPVASDSLISGGQRPPLPLLIAGFLVTCTVMGLVAATAARWLPSSTPRHSPHAKAAWVTFVAVVPLVVLGGLVTSTRSGLAVPDWPGTYGGNMFLYPVSLMASNNHVFLEHSHRLFGVLVGLCGISLVTLTFLGQASKSTKILACAALALIIVQGALGGLRVEIPSQAKAILHGILAQFIVGILGATVATACWDTTSPQPHPGDRKLRVFATALVHTTLIQVVFGAIFRHTGGTHALYTHIVISLAVLVLALMAGFKAGTLPRPSDRRTTGHAVVALVTIQFVLGWVALIVAPPSIDRTVPANNALSTITPTPGWKAALRTAHQANGALLLAASCALLAHTRRARATAATPRPE